jgi:hypothetical protein
MDRRQFVVTGAAALAGSRMAWAAPAATPEASGVEDEDGLRVMFRHGPHDRALAVYQSELRDTLAKLRVPGYEFEAVHRETSLLPVHGYLTGTCLFSIRRFPAAFAPVVGNFLGRKPERLVAVVLGDRVVHAFTPEDALRLPRQFAGQIHAL